jgi:heme A synthase
METDEDRRENFTAYVSAGGGKPKDLTLSNVLLGLLLVMLVIVIYVLAFEYGWNASMPELFDQRKLNFSSSLGLLLVVFILGIVLFRM